MCDDVTQGHIALNNILREVRKDWDKCEDNLLNQKVHNKYGTQHKPMPLKYAYLHSGKQNGCGESYVYQSQTYSTNHIALIIIGPM